MSTPFRWIPFIVVVRSIRWIGLIAPWMAWAATHSSTRGVLLFPAQTARLAGTLAHLDSKPGRPTTIAVSPDGEGRILWDYRPARWGRYFVELKGARAESKPVEIEVLLAGQRLQGKVEGNLSDEGSAVLALGTVYLEKADPFEIEVRPLTPLRAGTWRFESVELRPAPEGPVPPASLDGVLTLPAGAATTHSETLRYEPDAKKNCLGYWVNPSDWADWQFRVEKTATYDVELWQGCGRGQGGSQVEVAIGEQRLTFRVEETGHFQNFVPRLLGQVRFDQAGQFTLAIHPLSKQAAAVMDVRQVRLRPLNTAKAPPAEARAFVGAHRVVALGDSITYDGKWLGWVETWLRLNYPDSPAEILNLGLPSETVSGLSEPGHAGGAFPRPDLHERLDRILEKTHPDLILACYGMNDGIYQPPSEERLTKFQDGIRRLHERAAHDGIRVIHLTPPVFDPVPIADRTLPQGRADYPLPYAGYNEVLDQYAAWLVAQRSQGWQVIDLHGPMNRFLADRRVQNAGFTMAGDGVHPNEQGHWIMAREVLREFGAGEALVSAPDSTQLLNSRLRAGEIHEAIQQRQNLLKDAWLTEIGHRRPGMNPGKPLGEAEQAARELTLRLSTLIN